MLYNKAYMKDFKKSKSFQITMSKSQDYYRNTIISTT